MSTLAEIKAAIVKLTPAEIESLEGLLRERREQRARDAHLEELYSRNGVSPLPKRGDEVVTTELVRRFCEEEGV